MSVKLISITPNAESIISYCARVSSPHQDNPDYEKLIKYLITHKHWSPFEMAHMTLEIETSRAIAQQILRHRSFSFQEFSQRYAEAVDHITYEARRQDVKNRQNSIDDMSQETKDWFKEIQEILWKDAKRYYDKAIQLGIAKEQARFILPLGTKTRLYMSGSLRSWIHYLEIRSGPETQKEHRDIALGARKLFIEQFPAVAKALGWSDTQSPS